MFFRLTKICSLPSNNWSEFADMWFCGCKHGSNKKNPKEQSHPLSPTIYDCYVNSTLMWLHPKYLALFNTMDVDKKTRIASCRRCRMILGNVVNIGKHLM